MRLIVLLESIQAGDHDVVTTGASPTLQDYPGTNVSRRLDPTKRNFQISHGDCLCGHDAHQPFA